MKVMQLRQGSRSVVEYFQQLDQFVELQEFGLCGGRCVVVLRSSGVWPDVRELSCRGPGTSSGSCSALLESIPAFFFVKAPHFHSSGWRERRVFRPGFIEWQGCRGGRHCTRRAQTAAEAEADLPRGDNLAPWVSMPRVFTSGGAELRSAEPPGFYEWRRRGQGLCSACRGQTVAETKAALGCGENLPSRPSMPRVITGGGAGRRSAAPSGFYKWWCGSKSWISVPTPEVQGRA